VKARREIRVRRGFREVRLLVPDLRSKAVRQRIAEQLARLDPDDEREASEWIEAVSEFDGDPE